MSNVARIADHERYEAREDAAPQGKGAQLEDGFTRIANELFEAIICAPLTDRERRVVLAIVRLTYGWNRKEGRVTGGLLSKVTGLPITKASQTLSALVSKSVIRRNGGSRSSVSLNKHVDQWQVSQTQRVTPPPKQAKNAECDQTGPTDPKRYDSYQNGKSKPYQNGNASKDRKDNTPSLRSGDGASAPKKSPAKSVLEYTAEFETAWALYPKRVGSNPKREAFKSWRARLAEGVSADDMIAGVQRYAAHMDAKGSNATEFVMQGKRFFGPSAEFENDWFTPAPRADQYGAQGGNHANRQGFDQQRENRDRVAAMLADPHDTSWADGLFDEEGDGSGAGEPGLHATGGDFSQDVEDGFYRSEHGQAGQAGADYLDGEVVDATHDSRSGHGTRADQGRGRRVAAERGEAGQNAAAETRGFWNA